MICAFLAALLGGSTALAAPPADLDAGGFRVHSARPGQRLSARTVVVAGPVFAAQEALHLRLSENRVSWDLELPVVLATDLEGWREAGLGRVLGALRTHVGRESRHAVFLDLGANLAPPALWPTTWGSQSRETQPGWHGTVGWELDLPLEGWDWTLHAGLGLASERYLTVLGTPHGEFAMAQVVPLAGEDSVRLVLEQEAQLVDHVHLSARALARLLTGGETSIDLGLQQPVLTANDAPLLPQLLVQVRSRL